MSNLRSWSDLSPEQSAGLDAIIASYQAAVIDAETAIIQAGDILGIPAADVPDAMAAMTRGWMEENRELLEWASSLVEQ